MPLSGNFLNTNNMQRLAFKMKLYKGKEEEYKKRHAEIWPELVSLLKEYDVHDYSIFLDKETNILFGILKTNDAELLNRLPQEPLMQKWWGYMKDIMESNADNSPASISLQEVFYLS
jgi:L-rhamnose mutarotase